MKKKYILANFTRSYDDNHTSKHFMHILSSIFITDTLLLDNLINQRLNLTGHYVFKFRDRDEDLVPIVKECSNNLIIIEMTLDYFLNSYTNLKVNSNIGTDSYFNFLNYFIGNITTQKKDKKDLPMHLIQVLFIFEDLDWLTVYLLFRNYRVNISGGSISKRINLNTTDYTLSLFLFMMNYTLQDIFDSYKFVSALSKTGYESIYSARKVEIDEQILKNVITMEIKDNKETVRNGLEYLEKYVLQKNSELEVLNRERSELISKVKSNKKDINNSKKYLKLNKREEILKKLISQKGSELKNLSAELYNCDKDIKSLDSLNYEELLNKYFKEFHNFHREKSIRKIAKSMSKSKTLSNGFLRSKKIKKLSNRNYSTRTDSSMACLNKSCLDVDLELEQNKGGVPITNLNKLDKDVTHAQLGSAQINLSLQGGAGSARAGGGSARAGVATPIKNINSKKLNFHLDSPIYLELQRLIKNSVLDEQTQIKIEKFLLEQGTIFLNNKLQENLDINYYKLNPVVLNKLTDSIENLKKLLENYKNNLLLQLKKNTKKNKETVFLKYQILNNLDNEIIISFLLGRLLKIISNYNLINKNTICIDVAKDLVNTLNFYYLNRTYNNKKITSESSRYERTAINLNYEDTFSLSDIINTKKDLYNNIESDFFTVPFGFELLNFLEELDLIKTDTITMSKDHKQTIYIPNKIISEKLNLISHYLDLSYKIPMIVKPKNYSKDLKRNKNILGGYLLNDKLFISNLIIKNPELKEQSNIEDKNYIFNMVNNISRVPFKINLQVLEFIMENNSKFHFFTAYDYIHPMQIKLLQKKKENKKLNVSDRIKLEAFLSKKQLEMNILGLAFIFKNVPEFYIPVRMDNRGRVYCMSDYLNYQGIELAKALLLFSKGEKIYKNDQKSIYYLKIFGANCYGNGLNKKSFMDRISWIDKNEKDILNFENGQLISKADSKLLFLAFCFEYLNYKNSLNNSEPFFISHFPIQLDATCNGFQHLSLLIGDDPLAGELNFKADNEFSLPKDFYSFVGIKMKDYFEKLLKEFNESSDTNKDVKLKYTYERLLNLNIHRKLVKVPVMVKPYNASLYQMVNYIKEQFEAIPINNLKLSENKLLEYHLDFNKNKVLYVYKEDKNIMLSPKDLYTLTKSIEQIIYTEFPKLKEFNNYLKIIAEICTTLNIPILWALPSGLSVNQFYKESEAIRLKPFRFKKNSFSLLKYTNKINKAKQIRALMPNLIHSLDAASLALIVDMFFHNQENKNFYSVHDCFAVSCNQIEELIQIIKWVYIKIYTDNSYLKDFDTGIINSIKLQFGKDSFNDESKEIIINDDKNGAGPYKINYPNVENIISGRILASNIEGSTYIIQ